VLICNLSWRGFHALYQLGNFSKTALVHSGELIEPQRLISE
jgi:hypothetical protein